MNAKERKQIAALVSRLHALHSELETIGEQLREFADAEQEKFDNMSEGLQSSEKGERIADIASQLDEAATACENGDVMSAVTAAEEAIGL